LTSGLDFPPFVVELRREEKNHARATVNKTSRVPTLALDRRTAIYVDEILKDAKRADLPFAEATKFEFVINLKTAKAIGLPIPESVLTRADKVIK
jgi:ABC-type uncharacterized transport system substrate-binding protein